MSTPPERAQRDRLVRGRLVTHLDGLIDGSDAWTQRKRDELAGSLKDKPGLRRFPRRTPGGLLRTECGAIKREAGPAGKWLLRTNDETLTPMTWPPPASTDRRGTRLAVHERRPQAPSRLYHYREDRILAHVQLCWRALLLIRVIETAACDTWRNSRHELDRMHLVTLATADGHVAQRSAMRTAESQKRRSKLV